MFKIKENTVSALRKAIIEELEGIYEKPETAAMADVLVETLGGINKSEMIVYPDARVNQSVMIRCWGAVKRLKQYIPLQYILGSTEWMGMEWYVDPSVLIPRPETEELAEMAMTYMQSHHVSSVLDIGTGSGCIAIAVKKNIPACDVYAIDVSEQALQVAAKNAEKHETEVYFSHADFLDETHWKTLPETEMIISNPPYIGQDEKNNLEKNVLENEPHEALFSPVSDPLIFYHKICDFVQQRTSVKSVFLEINQRYGDAVAAIFSALPGKQVTVLKDINGNDRFCIVVD